MKAIVIIRQPDQHATRTAILYLKFVSESAVMYSYGLMEAGNYYLVREYEHGPIQLFQIMMHSDRCLLFQRYGIPTELEWRLQNDPLHEIIECLSEEQVKQWQYCFRSYEDAQLRSEDADEEED